MLTEMFVKNPRECQNFEILLRVLDEPSVQLRLSTIKLLITMLQNCPAKLQECFQAAPQGTSSIVELLNRGENEIIRNEALLLLIELTGLNVEIQKNIAFLGAFEKLLDILEAEGMSDGNVIIEDCLLLAQNLMRDNEHNQVYFRETGCVRRLAPIINVNLLPLV